MSNPTGCGAINLPVSNFTTNDQGQQTGTATGNATLGSQISINGSTDLSSIIVGPDNACVQSITYQAMDGPARNSVVYVFGQGPQGMGSGSLYLTFATQNTSPTNPHDLSLTSSSPKCHDDKFSDGSNLLKITWKHT